MWMTSGQESQVKPKVLKALLCQHGELCTAGEVGSVL